MIKSSKITTKYSRTTKRSNLNVFIEEYRRVVKTFVDLIWSDETVRPLLDKQFTSQINSWLSQRAIQCAGKQASSIVRGCKAKQNKRLYIINRLNKEGQFKKARKLKEIYLKNTVSKPDISVIQPELDSRFVKIDLAGTTSFDGWITLTSLGNKMSIKIPFKKHKHFNKMLEAGKLKSGIRVSNTACTFIFDVPEPIPVVAGKTLGIDIGQKTTLSCSNGVAVEADSHGHTYQSICQKLARKKKDSIAFKRAQKHRSNYIRWCVNQVDLSGIKQVNLENIKYLRKGKRTRRSLGHWNYAELFDVLESNLIDAGVQINKVNPTYTSQRCSCCGWVCKSSRKAKKFKCAACGFTADADLNASTNLSLDLVPLGDKKHLSKDNRNGFYWNMAGQEPIVPDALKV
jgi:IS605 OrfB family transposase